MSEPKADAPSTVFPGREGIFWLKTDYNLPVGSEPEWQLVQVVDWNRNPEPGHVPNWNTLVFSDEYGFGVPPGKSIGEWWPVEVRPPDAEPAVAALLAENARFKAVLAGIADRWDSCLSEERRGSMDDYDGLEMCREARRALGLGDGE